MNEISAMPGRIKDWLAGCENLSDIKFLNEFPPIKKAVPLRKITVAVGVSEVQINDEFANETEAAPEEEYCRKAVISLRFSIHVPFALGGVACHETFAKIVDTLTFESGLQITDSGCGKIKEDRQTEALVLAAYARVKANLCPGADVNMQFPSFQDKTLMCGSHIRNESIHLNENQLEFLNNPFTSGTYYGTGTAERSFNVGFAPKAVLIACGGMPPIAKSGEDFKLYTAMGVQGAGTLGLTLTQVGFSIKNGTGHTLMNTYPALNESGIIYSYIVLR